MSAGGAGESSGAGGMTDAVNSSSTASLPLVNPSYSLCGPYFPALGEIKQTSSDSCSCSFADFCLLSSGKY